MPPIRHASMLEVNEFLVLDFVRERGETTRPEVSEALGLSASSVSRITRRLVAEGLVREGAGTSTGGRPRTVISFNSRAGCVLGVDLGGTKCHAVLADLSGTIRWEDVRPTRQEGAPYPTLLAAIDTLLGRAEALGLPVAALAVGVPAVVDSETGLAIAGPNVRWDEFPIISELAGHVEVPFTVENDVNLAALAHAWRGDGRGRRDFVTLAIGTGIGAAVVVDGRLAKGHRGAAGEIGYLVLTREQLGERRDSALGGLERLASGPTIADRARALREASGTDEAGRDGGPGSPDGVTTESVFADALAGDPVARRLIDDELDFISMTVIALAAVASPEIVILEGSVGRALAPFVHRIVERVEAHLPIAPEIVVSSLHADATVLGAVAAALQVARRQRAPAGFFETLSVQTGREQPGGTLDVA